jgi:hypothetical protein
MIYEDDALLPFLAGETHFVANTPIITSEERGHTHELWGTSYAVETVFHYHPQSDICTFAENGVGKSAGFLVLYAG